MTDSHQRRATAEAAKTPMYLKDTLHGTNRGLAYEPTPPPDMPPTALEHIDNSLNQRVMRLDMLLEKAGSILSRMTGPRPEPPGARNAGTEANPGGRLGSIDHSCEVLDRQLNHLAAILDSFNSIA